ncbi:MAG TPA: metallophosphoesterase [Pyrinomonadaceae bacterium]|nr:metallophosphoesterase [Pyrinomonadaceae bacterium]
MLKRVSLQVFLSVILLVATFNQAGNAQTAKGTNVAATSAAPALSLALPVKEGSTRFAVMGDTGSGTEKQREVADMMARYRAIFPFDFVLMMGDNLYGSESAKDFQTKFSDVYKQLLDEKVKFYAALGNHDLPIQVNYEYFNMNGKEYYRFTKGNVAFYALNSNYMDKKQVQWLESELAEDTSQWKIAFCHHPPYSSASKHGSDKQLREVLEPIFLKYGVNVVLTGHDHVYERIKPQKGIYYFVSGAGGQLRSGDVKRTSPLTDKAYDRDMHFMLWEAVGDKLYFQTVSRTGETVDSGVIVNPKSKQ